MPTYTVPQVPGSKRTSDRLYNHAVIGRRNVANDRAGYAAGSPWCIQMGKNWDFQKERADLGAGGTIHAKNVSRPWSYELSPLDHGKHAAFIATNPDRAAYVEAQRLAGLAGLDRAYGTGDAGPLEVFQWSMSFTNANKGAASFRGKPYWVDVQVVPCVEVVKAPRAKAA